VSAQQLQKNLMCTTALIDLNQDQKPEILMRSAQTVYAFTQIREVWVGGAGVGINAVNAADFDAGKFTITPPQWQDLKIGDKELNMPMFANPDIRVTIPEAKVLPSNQPTNAVEVPGR
jgi:hypothetical protein